MPIKSETDHTRTLHWVLQPARDRSGNNGTAVDGGEFVAPGGEATHLAELDTVQNDGSVASAHHRRSAKITDWGGYPKTNPLRQPCARPSANRPRSSSNSWPMKPWTGTPARIPKIPAPRHLTTASFPPAKSYSGETTLLGRWCSMTTTRSLPSSPTSIVSSWNQPSPALYALARAGVRLPASELALGIHCNPPHIE